MRDPQRTSDPVRAATAPVPAQRFDAGRKAPCARLCAPADLNELRDNPQKVLDLDPSAARSLLLQLAGLVEMARLAAGVPATASHSNGHDSDGPDVLLTAEAVALRLGLDVDSVSRRRFPFSVKVGRRTVRYSERGLDEWMASGGNR